MSLIHEKLMLINEQTLTGAYFMNDRWVWEQMPKLSTIKRINMVVDRVAVIIAKMQCFQYLCNLILVDSFIDPWLLIWITKNIELSRWVDTVKSCSARPSRNSDIYNVTSQKMSINYIRAKVKEMRNENVCVIIM